MLISFVVVMFTTQFINVLQIYFINRISYYLFNIASKCY